MSSISQKRNNFKVQIRRKRIEDKIAQLRSNYMQQNMKDNDEQYTPDKINNIIQQTLSSKQNLIKNINVVKSSSYYLNQKNINLFFPLIPDFCYVLGNIQQMKQTQQIDDKNTLYNDILTTLINISSNQQYLWPPGQYLPIIKNLLIRQREINTMWLLSNILYQRFTPQTQYSLTAQLVKYDCIKFCSQRFNSKFQNQQDIGVFSCFVCSFLSNAQYLTLQELKRILKVVQDLSELNLQQIDRNILESMIDHAPYLSKQNYQILYSNLIPNFRQRYIKKRKTNMILKILEFIKVYIFKQIEQTLNPQNDNQFLDNKLAKKNYQRISLHMMPLLTLCMENLSPEVKANLMEICCMLLTYYFPFIDLQSQQIYVTLAEKLNKNQIMKLIKYSNKAIIWQLKLVYTLLYKLQQYKIKQQIIGQFIGKNGILEAFINLLREKSEVIEIVDVLIDLMRLLLLSVDKEHLLKGQNQKNQINLHTIKNELQIMLGNHMVKDQSLYSKIQQIIQICQHKY